MASYCRASLSRRCRSAKTREGGVWCSDGFGGSHGSAARCPRSLAGNVRRGGAGPERAGRDCRPWFGVVAAGGHLAARMKYLEVSGMASQARGPIMRCSTSRHQSYLRVGRATPVSARTLPSRDPPRAGWVVEMSRSKVDGSARRRFALCRSRRSRDRRMLGSRVPRSAGSGHRGPVCVAVLARRRCDAGRTPQSPPGENRCPHTFRNRMARPSDRR